MLISRAVDWELRERDIQPSTVGGEEVAVEVEEMAGVGEGAERI